MNMEKTLPKKLRLGRSAVSLLYSTLGRPRAGPRKKISEKDREEKKQFVRTGDSMGRDGELL